MDSAEGQSLVWPAPGDSHGDRQAAYNCSCGNDDRANACCCSECHANLRQGDAPCSYLGRCVEPLAWLIEDAPVPHQNNCLLFTALPRELREMIYAYALTGVGRFPTTRHNKSSETWSNRDRNSPIPTTDIAVNLLRTCRAIYLETYTLPLSLNPFVDSTDRPQWEMEQRVNKLLPWQFACIQSLDVHVSQVFLEGSGLWDRLLAWEPQQRRSSVCIAPHSYKFEGQTRHITKFPRSFGFSLHPAHKHSERQRFSDVFQRTDTLLDLPGLPLSTAMRVRLARPLVCLTLRLSRTDWWTWTDNPNLTGETNQLALDPAIGDGSQYAPKRPTTIRMQQLAEERRTGLFPSAKHQSSANRSKSSKSQEPGWAAEIGRFPDLKRLELVLETFVEKQQQLENVVECAKTWKFPIEGSRFELAWDGQIEESRWGKASVESTTGNGPPSMFTRSMERIGLLRRRNDNQQTTPWFLKSAEFEVRTVTFSRRRAQRNSNSET
ncbi:hypothetical protein P153DRAFT_43777 [Dothidotthia symphoricarpi CBS 119687]|uniref:Uncharacterized protein n=1 Tax=Dothidotthia symphoricarpi CBS 119687 TaxID=1392245 RepID=A0A6A6AB30_9PLEO|nr:uncharacterized protein P153DRAFT_43777 [Dothidotthia symphoricarpi CBS 119687]KAF2127911.1 hypothetical protein P153DRAFT_43777 [Dothidotthia symphoricarpi CBS 119687]